MNYKDLQAYKTHRMKINNNVCQPRQKEKLEQLTIIELFDNNIPADLCEYDLKEDFDDYDRENIYEKIKKTITTKTLTESCIKIIEEDIITQFECGADLYVKIFNKYPQQEVLDDIIDKNKVDDEYFGYALYQLCDYYLFAIGCAC